MIKAIKDWLSSKEKIKKDNFWTLITLLVASGVALLASFVLSVQALEIAANPDVVLSCSINAVVNCVSVALHPTASLLGFPNSFIGLMALPVIVTLAVALLMGGTLSKLFMFLAQLGVSLGFVFALALLYISTFIIQVICPWCFVTYIAMTVMFFALTRYNIRQDNLYLSKKNQKTAVKLISSSYDWLAMAIVIVAILALMIFKYGADLFA